MHGTSKLFDQPDLDLVSRRYPPGAKNCERRVSQVRGDAQPIDGIVMPTILPESG